MNHRDPHTTSAGRTNRDAGGRQYGDMPSVTDRRWETGGGRDDSFGPAQLGGYGDFAGADATEHLAGARAIQAVTQRALGLGRDRHRVPRNATRSDALITEELNERFTEDEQLDASEILLRVEDGHVLLTGEVPERWMKHRAEDIADAVRGVRDIENRIRVDDGSKSFGRGGPVRSGRDQPGSGFSSSPPNADWQTRDNRVD